MASQTCPICLEVKKSFICKICIHDRVSGRLVRLQHVNTSGQEKARELEALLDGQNWHTFLARRDVTVRRNFFLEEYVRQAKGQLKLELEELAERRERLVDRKQALEDQVRKRARERARAIPKGTEKLEQKLGAVRKDVTMKRSLVLRRLSREFRLTDDGDILSLKLVGPREMSMVERRQLNTALGYTVNFVNEAARYSGVLLPHRLIFKGSTSYAQTTYATPASTIPSELPLYLSEDNREGFVFAYAVLLFDVLHLLKSINCPMAEILAGPNPLLKALSHLSHCSKQTPKPPPESDDLNFSHLLKDVKRLFYKGPSYYESDVGGFRVLNTPGWNVTASQIRSEKALEPAPSRGDDPAPVVSKSTKSVNPGAPLPLQSWWQYQPSFHESAFFQGPESDEEDLAGHQDHSMMTSYVNVPSGSQMTNTTSPSISSARPEMVEKSHAQSRFLTVQNASLLMQGPRASAASITASQSRSKRNKSSLRSIHSQHPAVEQGKSQKLPPSDGSQVDPDAEWDLVEAAAGIPDSETPGYLEPQPIVAASKVYAASTAVISGVWHSHMRGFLGPISEALASRTPPAMTNLVERGRKFLTAALPPDGDQLLPEAIDSQRTRHPKSTVPTTEEPIITISEAKPKGGMQLSSHESLGYSQVNLSAILAPNARPSGSRPLHPSVRPRRPDRVSATQQQKRSHQDSDASAARPRNMPRQPEPSQPRESSQ